VQFAYAAVTSRLATPGAFGEYGIALAAAALVSLIASGGLAQAAARLRDVERREVSAIGLLGLLLGLVGAAALFASAGAWSTLWGAPEAAQATRVMAISALVAPMFGLVSGLFRRQGRFRQLASLTVASNIIGMGIGVLVVWQSPSSTSLVISQLVAQLLIVTVGIVAHRHLIFGAVTWTVFRPHLGFTSRLTAARLLAYSASNVGRLAVSNVVGAGALGQWNRADVVSAVPAQQVQNALVSVIYPEFRHDIESPDRARRVWTDLLEMLAWLVFPATALVSVALPFAIPILFGDGWDDAARIAPILMVAGGVATLTTTLSSAIEALGRFRWIWPALSAALGIQLAGALVTIATESWLPVLLALPVATSAQHLVNLAYVSHHGYLDARRVLWAYGRSGTVATAIAGFAIGLIAATGGRDEPWLGLACVAAVGVTFLVIAILQRRRMRAFIIAREHWVGQETVRAAPEPIEP